MVERWPSGGQLEAIFGPSYAILVSFKGVSWNEFGPSWSGPSWAMLGPCWAILGHLEAILAILVSSWDHVSAILETCWSHLRHSGAILGTSRDNFGTVLVPSWA
jgi:hypothetical protein